MPLKHLHEGRRGACITPSSQTTKSNNNQQMQKLLVPVRNIGEKRFGIGLWGCFDVSTLYTMVRAGTVAMGLPAKSDQEKTEHLRFRG